MRATATAVRADAMARARATVAARATEASRRCADPRRVVGTAAVSGSTGGLRPWLQAVGTLRNTCTFAVEGELRVMGTAMAPDGAVFPISSVAEPFALLADEERAFVHPLGQQGVAVLDLEARAFVR
jgi:hypothetical protein